MPGCLRVALVGVCFAALAMTGTASAAFPGKNGKIAFTRALPTTPTGISLQHTFVAESDGSVPVDLTPNDPPEFFPYTFPSWSSDGAKLVFGAGLVEIMNADGSGRTALVGGAAAPSWSPHRTRVAFERSVGTSGQEDVFVINADGTGLVDLTADFSPPTASDVDPVWSPDGTRIAFATSKNATGHEEFEIYTMRPDGSDPVRLTQGHRDLFPDWSPDGSKLVFGRFEAGLLEDWDLWVVGADGSGERRLMPHTNIDEEGPVWSPDGSTILFDRSSFRPALVYDLWTVGADGTGERLMIENGVHADWQPIPGPQRSDYKNAAQFCKAERSFWGDQFPSRYGGHANAYGKCVGQNH